MASSREWKHEDKILNFTDDGYIEKQEKGMNCGVLVIVLMAVVVLPVTFFVGWYMGASEAYQQGQSVYAERVDKMLSVEQQRVLEG